MSQQEKLNSSSVALPAPILGLFHLRQNNPDQCDEESHYHGDEPLQGQNLRLGTLYRQYEFYKATLLTNLRTL